MRQGRIPEQVGNQVQVGKWKFIRATYFGVLAIITDNSYGIFFSFRIIELKTKI